MIGYEFDEENDMQKFRARPADACEGMQKKYLGTTYKEYKEIRDNIKDYDGEVGEYQELVEVERENPFTHEKKVIKELRDIPQPSEQEIIENRIQELKVKLIKGTITAEEKEELKLLIG